MKIIVAYSKNKKAKIKATGNSIDLLALLVAISKALSERISKEKKIDVTEAENFIIKCISDGMKIIKD